MNNKMEKIKIISGHPTLENSTANKTILGVFEKENNISITKLIETYPNYEINVESEINQLLKADVIVLQFPFYWYGVPAILKMWIDSITTSLVYGTNKGGLKGKTFILSTTTGGPEESYQASGHNKYTMKELLLPLLKLGDSLGMNVMDPFILYNAMFKDDEGKLVLENHAINHALKLIEISST